jgi:hypothetical protein
VKKIYAVDSSSFFLNNMLGEIIKLMDGKREKVIPIQGLFTPLIMEDKSLDIVVDQFSIASCGKHLKMF